MAKTVSHDVCAHIPAPGGQKGKYIKIGVAMQDDENGSWSLKIDTLPLAGSGWQGWLNLFPKTEYGATKQNPTSFVPRSADDDVPF